MVHPPGKAKLIEQCRLGGRCQRKPVHLGPKIKQTLQEANLTGWLASLIDKLEPCQELRVQLEQALDDHCPLVYREGGFIRPGYHSALDELRGLAAGGKQWMANYQAEQIEATGISSLKVGYNKVFGYYLEVTHTHRQRVPDYFVRKQTLKNAERYITEELKEYEERVLTADDRARELEIELFMRLREAVDAHRQPLADAAERLAQLDCLAGLAELAVRQGYVRPTLTEEPVLEIKEGRHPVLDAQLAPGSFVPNDVLVGQQHGRVLLITGPNMAGKSTYIRQTALLVIMAQMGSFIPAASATIGVADRVFARVGASDELARGQSTFMVEMVETARILNTATERSLVILDEIGRGTSTYDGLSLAWAIVEHLHDHLQPRTLFATHYHELTELGRRLTGVQNWNVAVKEWQDSIVFLHRIVPGGADRSYGIHVARLAGVPDSVNQRAGQILENLERQRSGTEPPAVPAPTHRPIQMKLFELVPAHPLLDQLRQLDIDRLSPIEALSQLKSWQQELHAAQSAEPTVAGAHHLKSSR
jgi:DNA mismatch repair protein MutS